MEISAGEENMVFDAYNWGGFACSLRNLSAITLHASNTSLDQA